MRTPRWFLPGVIPCIVITCLAMAAHKEPPVRFENLSNRDGLSNTGVYKVIQDRNGFLWLATSDGLNRYDGFDFKVFRNIPDDPNSLGDNRLLTLYEDSSGYIWVGLEGEGLDRYDPATGQFTHFKREPGDQSGLANNYVRAILQDPKNPQHLWVGTQNGLSRYNMDSGIFENFRHDFDDPHSLASSNIRALLSDKSGNLWIGMDGGGLGRYDRERNRFESYRPNVGKNDREARDVNGDSILAMHEEPAGVLWLGTESGLLRFDVATGHFQSFEHDPKNHHSVPVEKILAIASDGEGGLWVGSFGGGLTRFNPLNGRAVNYVNDPLSSHSLPQNRIRCLLVDRSDMLWIGTSAQGLAYCHRTGTRFFTYANHPLKPKSLAANEVNVIVEDSREDIWVGTTGGLNRLLSREGSFKRYQHNPNDPHSLTANGVYSLYEDSKNVIWVGTPQGLNRFDRQKDRFVRYQHQQGNRYGLSSNDIWAFQEDHEGYLWVGTWDNGLSRYDRKTDRFSWWLHDPSDRGSLSHSTITDIKEDGAGNLWIATFGGGLNRLGPDRSRFEIFRKDTENPESLAHDSLQVIHQDGNGVLWLGTGGGLSRFDPRSRSFRNYFKDNGLPSNIVNGILEDNRGYLWVSTNQGISKFDPVSETFWNLTIRDGLQGNIFNMAYCKTASGELMFGGKNGFNIFDPEHIKPNPTPPQIALTDFRILNQSVPLRSQDPKSPLTKAIEQVDELVLDHKDYAFSLQFASLHFGDPQRNRYEYRLEPFDKDWVATNARNRLAHYTNLDPGRYVFQVKAASKDGVWSDEVRSLNITILPAPWKTWWAYSIYVLLAGLVYLAVEMGRLRRKRKLEEKNAELAATNVELQTLDDIVRVINHEISLDTVLKALLDQGLRLFKGADRGGFLLWDETHQNYRIAATTGYDPGSFQDFKHLTFTREELISRYTEDSEEIGRGIYLVRNEKSRPGSSKLRSDPKSMIAMAVTIKGQAQGFVVWDNYSDVNAFKPDDAHRLNRFREHAISAITKAHMLYELKNKNREIMQTRDQLVVQEKMASLGTLTAGIAHEIRNPLNFINNFAVVIIERFEELVEELDKNREKLGEHYYNELTGAFEELKEDAVIIVNHGQKAGHIVKSMIEIASAEKGERRETDLNRLVDEFVNLTHHTFQEKYKDFQVNIRKHFDPEIRPCVCAPHNLSRALVNLITNGFEAILERLQRKDGPYEPTLMITTMAMEEHVEIRIEDNGVGISEDQLDRVFHPFYTTKQPDQGHVGLGLWISYDIITKEHHGELTLQTDNDRTACVIRLPLTHELTWAPSHERDSSGV